MASEYNAAQRVLHQVKQNVSDFELGRSNGSDASAVQAAIAQGLETLGQRIAEYRILGRQETNERKRKTMLDRATAMGDEHEQLKRRYEKLRQRRAEQALHASERHELFQRGAGAARAPVGAAVVVDLHDEDAFYRRAEQDLDGYIAQGMASLENLREQRGFLNNAHQRILSAAETLGLSRTVITMINRRTTQDKIILGAGMAVTCASIYFILQFFG
ncbi:protein transport protein bos1 [Coemansia javaensis]|uniref:Protein transport protein BOS1 n=1 Tax=Coemansia javaensis TaxID=2761396 RepID=A0A9W8LCM6_9FUNG|nr:protein transport protein bos1 [Coemansia javaensis]